VIPSALAPQIANRYGMIWGGDFGCVPDGMHFEIHVGPDQISGANVSGLAGGTAWSGPAGVEQWRSVGLTRCGRRGSRRRWIGDLLRQMNQESSGNPTIQQLPTSTSSTGLRAPACAVDLADVQG